MLRMYLIATHALWLNIIQLSNDAKIKLLTVGLVCFSIIYKQNAEMFEAYLEFHSDKYLINAVLSCEYQFRG